MVHGVVGEWGHWDCRLDDDFDAVVGCLILAHVPDTIALLRRVSALVRPSGLVAFQEPDHTCPVETWPRARLFEQARCWRLEATRRAELERQDGIEISWSVS
jgi:hypothetical protein